MAYSVDQNTGDIVINGWEKGIAASPHEGIADLKNVNITTEQGEVSVNYSRVRQDQPSLTSQSFSSASSLTIFDYVGSMTVGTWVIIDTIPAGEANYVVGNYYQVISSSANQIELSATFMGSAKSASAAGTFTFHTLAMGVPEDYTIELTSITAADRYRYYILDQNGIIWVSGTASLPGNYGALSPTTTWSAISPNGSSNGAINAPGVGTSIVIMYATDGNNKITNQYLMIFTQSQIYYTTVATWPSKSGGSYTSWQSFNYSGGFSHKSILGIDQVVYFCDGPGIGVFYQVAGQQFDPTNTATYSYVNAQYIMSPEDVSTRIVQLPSGNSLSIIVGGLQNNLYIYPDVQSSSSSKPTSVLWMPESNTQYFVQANNFVFVFCGSKGNIYLTNGSSVVPIATVPDYVAGSVTYVQDPYFVWGGAMYLRGRLWFSIKDQTATHTGNCGGVWSFVPTMSYFINQDTGLSLRLENSSSQSATHGYNGYATLLFAGQETTAQQNNGAQYVACWNQTTGSTTTNSVDFSGTNPYSDSANLGGYGIIETDVIPVGTFLNNKTFSQIEYKLSAQLAAGESIAINYRQDLEQPFASAGTVITESGTVPDPVSGIITGVNFENSEIIQLQLILTSTSTSPSWCRLKEIYIR